MLITVVTLVVVAYLIGGRRPHQDSSCLRRRLPRDGPGRGDCGRRDGVSILGALWRADGAGKLLGYGR